MCGRGVVGYSRANRKRPHLYVCIMYYCVLWLFSVLISRAPALNSRVCAHMPPVPNRRLHGCHVSFICMYACVTSIHNPQKGKRGRRGGGSKPALVAFKGTLSQAGKYAAKRLKNRFRAANFKQVAGTDEVSGKHNVDGPHLWCEGSAASASTVVTQRAKDKAAAGRGALQNQHASHGGAGASASAGAGEGVMKVFPLKNGAYTAPANPVLQPDTVRADGHSLPVDESVKGAEINLLHREFAQALKKKMPDIYNNVRGESTCILACACVRVRVLACLQRSEALQMF